MGFFGAFRGAIVRTASDLAGASYCKGMKLFVWFIVLGFLVVACGGSDGASGSLLQDRGPIAEYLGFENDPLGGVSPESMDAQYQQELRLHQEAVAACMTRAGFEYVPFVAEGYSLFSRPDTDFDHFSREWPESFGFGYTTNAFAQDLIDPDLVGRDRSAEIVEILDNPNREILLALTEPEQDIYQETLYGPENVLGIGDEPLENPQPGGCQAEANEVLASNSGLSFRVQFRDELGELMDQVAVDPRVVARDAEVESCVRSKGFEIESYNAIRSGDHPWQDAIAEIRSALESRDPDEGLDFEEIEAMSQAEQDAFFAERNALFDLGPVLSADQNETLRKIQLEEIQLATVVFDCGGLNREEFELRTKVHYELQERFVEENSAKLDAFRNNP